MTNLVAAMAVQHCPHHFVMEWDSGAYPVGAKIDKHVITKLTPSMLDNDDRNAPLLGFYIPLPPELFQGHAKQRILVGTDFDNATNPDGSPCTPASQEILEALSKVTGIPAARDDQKKIRRKRRDIRLDKA